MPDKQFQKVYINIDHYNDMLCKAAASTLNINVPHQTGRDTKHPYASQSIAQKMLAYITQHLCKSEQNSAVD